MSLKKRLWASIDDGDAQALNAVLGTEGSRFFLNARDENGCTALHKAAANGFVEVVQLLLTAGAKVALPREEDERTALHVACAEGHLHIVEVLLQQGASLSARDFDGWTPLHCAAYNGDPRVTAALLQAGAQAEDVSPVTGATSLLLAAEMCSSAWVDRACDYAAVVRLLVAAGASPCTPDAMGDTPLHLAVRAGNTHVVQALCCVKAVAAGSAQGPVPAVTGAGPATACISAPAGRTSGSATPLHLAAAMGHADICRVLLTAGADTGCREASGLCPLHVAVQAGSLPVVHALLAAHVDPCMADAHGLTPLHMAAQIADDEHLVAQQDPSKRDTATDSTTGTHVHGDSSLTVPVTESQSAVECIIKALATAGADVNAAAGMQRVTPLHLAGAMGHAAALRALLAAGADATQQDAAGKTALQQSTDRGSAQAVKLLEAARSQQ